MRSGILISIIVAAYLVLTSAVFAAEPVLEVSPTYLEFSAYRGVDNQVNQILSIWRGGGNGPLNWQVIEDCNWLVVEPNSGKSMGEVDDVNVIVDISGLVEGTYNCYLTVDAGTAVNSPQIVDVDLVIYSPRFVSWWKFDEGSGTTAYDSKGINDGTITGATWIDDPCRGMCLSFDGESDYVLVGDKRDLEQQKFTLSFWAQVNIPSESHNGGIAKGWVFGMDIEFSYELSFHAGDGRARITTSNSTFSVTGSIGDAGWHMWTMTVGDGTLVLYKDGAFVDSTSYTGAIDHGKWNENFVIGARDNGGAAFNGKMDDVRFYNRALLASEIEQLYYQSKAFAPQPASGATGVGQYAILSWSPGEDATSHDVYFGTSYNDVNNATTASAEYMGRQEANSWDPCGLDLFTTYYWRIDEVNEPNLWKGFVWSFMTGDYDGTCYVPSEYSTIQAAINAAASGNIVILAPGTYTGSGNRDLDFDCRAITVRSIDPNDPGVVAATVIDCENVRNHRGFYFRSGEGPNSIVSGITIKRGWMTENVAKGAGIYCHGSSPTIKNCIIANNTTSGYFPEMPGDTTYGGVYIVSR